MRLLYVTAEVPWPLTSGYLRHYHLLEGLGARHTITLVSLTRRPTLPAGAREAVAPLVDRLEVVAPAAGAAGGRLARNVAVRRAARDLRRVVAREAATGGHDAVMLSGKDTFPVLASLVGAPLVIDVCDAASMRLTGELAVTSGLRRTAPLRLRLAEMRHIERRLVRRTPHLLFASERDRAEVGARAGAIVANGVDLGYWSRRTPDSDVPRVAFSGAMAYRPNDDAARRLVERILPLVAEGVPEVSAVLAGRDPLPALAAAAAASAVPVAVTGTVTDLRPHLEPAAVYCAPLRFGAGIQNKLLEALAFGIPVVTTPLGAAGLRLDGAPAPLVVADGDAEIAAAVSALLRDPERRRRLAAEGRGFVERHFSWTAAIDAVDAVLHRATNATTNPLPLMAATGGTHG